MQWDLLNYTDQDLTSLKMGRSDQIVWPMQEGKGESNKVSAVMKPARASNVADYEIARKSQQFPLMMFNNLHPSLALNENVEIALYYVDNFF